MLRRVLFRVPKGVRSFAKAKKLPTSEAEWGKVLTTPPPNAPQAGSGTAAKYASYSLNAAYNLNAIPAMRSDFAYLKGVFKNEHSVQAVKEGKGSTADFVNDMSVMFQASQCSAEEIAKLEGKDSAATVKALAKYPGLSPLTQQMLGSFKDEGVIFDFPEIADEFEAQAAKVLKEVQVQIIAAAELSANQKTQILNVVQKYVDKESNIILSEKTDPSLIAGFQLLIEDRFVDLSAKKSVDNLMSKIPSA